ncbi:MAG: methyltransferase [Eubacteriales bacterium]
MTNHLLNNIITNCELRQSLSQLRQEIKQDSIKSELKKDIKNYIPEFIELLKHTDAKTRKNTALLMGDLGMYEFLPALFEGYKNESQRFVKSSYLIALQCFDCSIYLGELKEILNTLTMTPLNTENQKHIQEEIRALSKLLVQEEGISNHTFTGFHYPLDCILLTNKLHKELLECEITDGEIIPFRAGVRVVTENLNTLLDLRTYSELLFVIPGLSTLSADPIHAAKSIVLSNLLPMLRNIHQEKTPFYFRVELKSKLALDQKSRYAKSLSSELERLSSRSLINSTSNYEVELRLIENKTGMFNILIKLFTIPDERFSYRTESIAASIRPVNAAQLVALAADYMIEDSRTLDPFCGVGTMLIERQKVVKGNTSYGIDFYAPAIEKARINTENAGQIIHYINRNFFDFTHEYPFDEIFTNMPYSTGHKSEEEIEMLYKDFFPKAREVLTRSGTIIMYSRNPELVRELSFYYKYNITKAIEIVPKENSWLFIIQFIL